MRPWIVALGLTALLQLPAAGTELKSDVIAAAIFASFRSSWLRDVRSLSRSASILIARVPLPSWRMPRPMQIRSRAAHCARASALAVDMGLLIHPTGDPRRDL